MGIAGSPDIFQAEMMKLMESLEYVQAYIDDLLYISRESFDNHLDKLEEVLKRLHDAGLKGMVQANVGQKLVKRNILRVFFVTDFVLVKLLLGTMMLNRNWLLFQ